MINRIAPAIVWSVLFFFLISIVPVNKAQAYLDPGSGSLIIQVVIGGILGLLVAVKLYWSKIVGFVSRRKSSVVPDSVQMSSDQGSTQGDDRP